MNGRWWIRVIFVVLVNRVLSHSSEILRQRGVSSKLATLYGVDGSFVCLDGRRTVQYSQVNDDYCDCSDGSDEPGTNACDAGIFHCPNVGYHFKDISSSRVDDGICDCCDGTDELKSMAHCVIDCRELGKQEMNQIKIKAETVRKGIKLKYELEREGKYLKMTHDKRLLELEEKKKEYELLVDAKTRLKNEVEQLEQEAKNIFKQKKNFKASITTSESDFAFAELDVDHNGLLDITDIQTRAELDSDQDGFISIEEAEFFMQGRESMNKDEFSRLWPKMKHYLSMKTLSPGSTYQDTELSQEKEKGYANVQEIESIEDTKSVHDKIEDDEFFSGADSNEGHSDYDIDTQRIINEADQAREDLHKTNKQFDDLLTEIRSIEKWMQIDYGEQWEFATLNGKCFSFADREYTYKFCPFESTSQKQNVGGTEISLGIWSGWSDKGTKYREMQYNSGASCWNGPQRSSKVKLECGVEQIVTSVLEPIRCEYEFVFHTPAACNVTSDLNDFHDEL